MTHGRDGELLAPLPGRRERWRLVTGEHRVRIEAPLGGDVTEVRPGAEIRIRASGPAIRGAFAAGSAARGRLELATDPFGELRPGGIDVGRAGSILVVGSRIDAEALTRARAMNVRGIVVATLPGKELRDFQASERRQRASLHPTAPFGVLVLDGTVRRPIASPIAAILERMAGTEVALLVDPPALVFDADPGDLPVPDADWVRVRSGIHAGLEGRVVLLLGPAAVRGQRAARGGARGDRRRPVAGRAAGGPRAPHVTLRRTRRRPSVPSSGGLPSDPMSSPTGVERVVTTRDATETRALAARLATVARPGDLLCLVGDLGAGKTQFAKGFAVGLGITDIVSSPTFVLMTEYDGRLPLFHLDLYRLDDAADALAGGLLDERQLEGVALVEWAERLGGALPVARLDVVIDGTGDEPRRIALRSDDPGYARYLEAAA